MSTAVKRAAVFSAWGMMICLVAAVCTVNYHVLWSRAHWAGVSAEAVEQETFLEMRFGENGLERMEELAEETGLDLAETAAVCMIHYSFAPTEREIHSLDAGDVLRWREILNTEENLSYQAIEAAYRAILEDVECFPVARSTDKSREWVSFGNTWMEQRTYGGERRHEGTDIMGAAYDRGTYPVVSMTDGIIKKMGWLEMGGWRIGIYSPSGGYFYYAHLYSYAPGLSEGDEVRAGQLLGYMGDSGYGKEEGTVGLFPVHLHMGIYLDEGGDGERSVNPYWILWYAQKYNFAFDY